MKPRYAVEGVVTTVDSDGNEWWYKDGELHRDNAPAVIYASGASIWYQHGQLHREGGPAIDGFLGLEQWYLHGKKHRADGPASIPRVPDNTGQTVEEWWFNGKQLANAFELAAAVRRQADAALLPFRGTLNPVVAPEKAAFKKHARRPL